MCSLNIAINIAITGGIGGIERNLFTFAKAMKAHSIDIYTMQFIPRGFVPSGNNVTIRWFEKQKDQLHITLEDEKVYDLYFYYAACSPIYIGEYLKARKRVVIPNGNDVREIEHHFDYVFCQAEDGIRYFDDMSKKLPITPCVIIPVDKTEPIEDLPPELREKSARGFFESDWQAALRSWSRHNLKQGNTGLLRTALPAFESIMIETALEHTGGRRQDAARLLGLGRNTLTRKIKELELGD